MNTGIVVELDFNTTVVLVVVEGDQVMLCASVATVGGGLRRDATFITIQFNGTACESIM